MKILSSANMTSQYRIWRLRIIFFYSSHHLHSSVIAITYHISGTRIPYLWQQPPCSNQSCTRLLTSPCLWPSLLRLSRSNKHFPLLKTSQRSSLSQLQYKNILHLLLFLLSNTRWRTTPTWSRWSRVWKIWSSKQSMRSRWLSSNRSQRESRPWSGTSSNLFITVWKSATGQKHWRR